MHSTVPTAVEFKTKLGFNPHDPIMRKEQAALTKIMKVFASEKILLQHYVLGYRTDLYFLKHKLAIETDEKRHKNRNKYKKVKRKMAIETDLDHKFISRDKKDFDAYVEIGKIYNHINKSSQNCK